MIQGIISRGLGRLPGLKMAGQMSKVGLRFNSVGSNRHDLHQPSENTIVRDIPVSVDTELPDPFVRKRQNHRMMVIYGIGVFLGCAFVFNYEKTSSPIVNSVFYCLRRSEEVKKRLGDNITYSSAYPWISGPLNTVQGNINIKFGVKGDDDSGVMVLRASRTSRLHPFDIHQWTLTTSGGDVVDLDKDVLVELGV